ncbi:MAG: PAS domain S-box protein [Thermoplasmatota archaeon]
MTQDIDEDLYEKIVKSGILGKSIEDEEVIKKICKLIFEHSNDMISLLDKNSVPIFVNKAHSRILGYSEDELLGKPALELFHPDDKDKAKRKWSKSVNKKVDIGKIIARFKVKDEDYIWLETHLRTLTGDDNEVCLVLCISRDISDKVLAEQRLKENKEKVEKLHEVAHKLDTCRTEDEIFDICMDASKTILNFDYISTFKKVEEGFEGKAVSYEITPKLKGDIYDKKNFTWQTYITGKSFLVKNIDDIKSPKAGLTEYKSGISIPIGEYGVFQALSKEKNRYDEDDLELAELLVSHMNQTLKRIEYQSKLKESEERYRFIFENTGTATMIVEKDTTIALVNEEIERLSGYSREEIEGKMSFEEVLVKSEVEKVNRYHYVRRHVEDSVPSQYESKVVTKYGDIRNVLVSVRMMPDSDRSIVSMLDITNYRKNLKALSESEELFRIAFDKSPIGMIRLDHDFKINDVNEKICELLDCQEEKLLYKNFTDFIAEDEKKEKINNLKEVLVGEPKQFNTFLKNGQKKIEVDIKAEPIMYIDGEVKHILLHLS